MGDDVILKTLALITMNLVQNAIDTKPFVNLDLNNGKHLLIVGNKGLTELGEGISQH